MRLFRTLPAFTLVLGACASTFSGAGQEFEDTIAAPPQRVIQATATVFRDAAIPVGSVSPRATFLHSEPFRVRRTWGADPVESRLECGRDELGEPLSGHLEVVVRIEAYARPDRSREPVPNPTPAASSNFLLRVEATALDPRESNPDGTLECTLTPTFRDALLTAIRKAAMGEPVSAIP